MSELVEFPVGLFHLVVLGIKDDTLLNLFNILLLKFIVTNRKLFYTEISLQGLTDIHSSSRGNAAIEEFEHDEGLVIINQLSDGLRTSIANDAISEIQVGQGFIFLQRLAKLLSLFIINFTVGYV